MKTHFNSSTVTSEFEEVPAILIQGDYYIVPVLVHGESFGADQCEDCGSPSYRVTRGGRYAQCVGDDVFDGCGQEYPVKWVISGLVTF